MAPWIMIAGILGTGIWLWKIDNVTDIVQIAISTAEFFIWVCALDMVTVTSLLFYNAVAAGLILFVFGAPLIDGIPDTV